MTELPPEEWDFSGVTAEYLETVLFYEYCRESRSHRAELQRWYSTNWDDCLSVPYSGLLQNIAEMMGPMQTMRDLVRVLNDHDLYGAVLPFVHESLPAPVRENWQLRLIAGWYDRFPRPWLTLNSPDANYTERRLAWKARRPPALQSLPPLNLRALNTLGTECLKSSDPAVSFPPTCEEIVFSQLDRRTEGIYAFRIDWQWADSVICEEFRKWLGRTAPELPGRRTMRNVNNRLPFRYLKQLAAFRLANEGYSQLDALQLCRGREDGKNDVLPRYSRNKWHDAITATKALLEIDWPQVFDEAFAFCHTF